MTTGACLGDDTIAAMVEGRLAGDAAHHARGHVSTCDACRELVAATMRDLSGYRTENIASTLSAGTPGNVDPAIGTLFDGRYRLERLLGEGGGGRVYVARHIHLDKLVALKLAHPEHVRDPVAAERFSREARLIASLAHEHLVQVLDLGYLGRGERYLAMELLEGEDLGAILQRGPIALPQAIAWTIDACEALAVAHAAGIVHRDIKPSNLFITHAGTLKVLDFGLAKQFGGVPSMTATGMIVGSPRYMAPEQISGSKAADPRADIWSLGATLYHMATGRPPFDGHSIEAVFGAILTGGPPAMDGLPHEVAAVIERCLVKDPDARFSTVSELAAALRSPMTPREGPPMAVTVARRRGWWPVAMVVVVVATGSLAYVAGARSQSQVAPAKTEPGSNVASRSDSDTHALAGGDATAANIGAGSNIITNGSVIVGSISKVPPIGSASNGSSNATDTGDAAAISGPLGNLDDTRLRARLTTAGWKITLVERQSFPGCDHTRFVIEKAQDTGDVYLLVCDSQMSAASEAARLRHGFARSWIVAADRRVLMSELADEHASKELSDRLVVP